MGEAGDSHAETIARLTDKVEGLEEALQSRDIIGQAKGILMERFHITPDQAFEELRTASQQLNIKLRDLAARVAETGQWPVELERRSSNGQTAH